MNENIHTTQTGGGKKAHLVLLALFLIALCCACYLKIHNNDIFWHLSVGREIMTTGQISFPNVFDSTSDGRVYHNLEWLFEVPVYLLATLDPENFTYLILLRIVFMAAVYLLLWRLGAKRGLSAAVIVAFLTVSFLSLSFRLYVRTFLVTYLMTVLFVTMLSYNASRDKPDKRMLWLIPLLEVIWSNCHPICYVGVGLVGMAWLAEGIRVVLEKRPWDRLKHLTLLGVLTFGATFIHFHPGRNLARVWFALVDYPKLLVVKEEGFPPFDVHPEFYFLVALGAVLIPFAIKSKRWFELMVFVSFSFFAIRTVRFVGLFSLASMVYFFVVLTEKPIAAWIEKFDRVRTAPLLGAAILIAGMSQFFSGGLVWGRGVDCAKLPCSEVDFMLEHTPNQPFFNSLGYGGYTIWRGYPALKPFWDGRFEAQMHLFKGLPRTGFSEFLLQNKMHLALLPNRPPVSYHPLMPIEKEILDDEANWVPIYYGRCAVLMAHPDEKTIPLIEQYGYRLIKPWKKNMGLPANLSDDQMLQFFAEASRTAQMQPEDPFALWLLAQAFWKVGDREKSRQACSDCLVQSPNSTGCLTLMGLVELSTDEPGAAIGHLKRAVRLGQDDLGTLNNLGAAYLQTGNLKRAEKTFKSVLKQDPDNKLANFNLSLVYEDWGEKELAERYRKKGQ